MKAVKHKVWSTVYKAVLYQLETLTFLKCSFCIDGSSQETRRNMRVQSSLEAINLLCINYLGGQ